MLVVDTFHGTMVCGHWRANSLLAFSEARLRRSGCLVQRSRVSGPSRSNIHFLYSLRMEDAGKERKFTARAEMHLHATASYALNIGRAIYEEAIWELSERK